MDNDNIKISDQGNNLSSPPLVQITVLDPFLEEEAVRGSSLNDNIDNKIRCEFANVEIPKHEFDKRIQDIGCTKSEFKEKQYQVAMIPAYIPKVHKSKQNNLASITIDQIKNFKKEHELQ